MNEKVVESKNRVKDKVDFKNTTHEKIPKVKVLFCALL
jgi:hypothetical protein